MEHYLTIKEALNVFYTLQKVKIITGDEFLTADVRKKLSGKVPHWIAMNVILKEGKAAYIRALPEAFFERSKKYKDFTELAKNIYEVSVQNGSSITYVNTGLTPENGYFAAEVRAPVLKVKTLTPVFIENYIRDVYDTWFKGLKANRYFLGIWYYKEEREWHISVSKTLSDFIDEAREYCCRNGLRAFYSLSSNTWWYEGKYIYVDDL